MKKLLVLAWLALALGSTAAGQTEATDSTGRCQGLFSVGDSVRVRFSKGNLQYQPSTGLWRFAQEQTEALGWEAKQAQPRYKGWVDLFGWGTGMEPMRLSEQGGDYAFVDWGRYCALPTDGGRIWRTLTIEEWTYLLSKRAKARRLYAVAYVEGRYGLVLLPDEWRCPEGVYVKTGPKEERANWLTAEKWQRMEAAGAVFLPCEATRMGTTAKGSAACCHYWTASASSKKSDEALYILLDAYFPQGRSASKATGMSVRLVQEM